MLRTPPCTYIHTYLLTYVHTQYIRPCMHTRTLFIIQHQMLAQPGKSIENQSVRWYTGGQQATTVAGHVAQLPSAHLHNLRLDHCTQPTPLRGSQRTALLVHRKARPGPQACHQRGTFSCYCYLLLLQHPAYQLQLQGGCRHSQLYTNSPYTDTPGAAAADLLTPQPTNPLFYLTHSFPCSVLLLLSMASSADHCQHTAAHVSADWQQTAGRHLLMRRVSTSGNVQRQTGQLMCSFSHVWMQPLQNSWPQGSRWICTPAAAALRRSTAAPTESSARLQLHRCAPEALPPAALLSACDAPAPLPPALLTGTPAAETAGLAKALPAAAASTRLCPACRSTCWPWPALAPPASPAAMLVQPCTPGRCLLSPSRLLLLLPLGASPSSPPRPTSSLSAANRSSKPPIRRAGAGAGMMLPCSPTGPSQHSSCRRSSTCCCWPSSSGGSCGACCCRCCCGYSAQHWQQPCCPATPLHPAELLSAAAAVSSASQASGGSQKSKQMWHCRCCCASCMLGVLQGRPFNTEALTARFTLN